jgi:predicted nucleic acid-binding protein
VKIVLDTTILVRSNDHSQGLARELLLKIIDSKHRLLLSNEMLHELARVLRYPRLRAFYDLPENLVFDYVNFLRRSAEIVTLDPLVAAPIRDVNDIVRHADGNNRRSGHTMHERRRLLREASR